VCSPELLHIKCRSAEQMRLVNGAIVKCCG